MTPVLETARLRLRETRAEDFPAVAALWADPIATRYITGKPQTPAESWLRMLRLPGLWALLGYGYWTVEARESGEFVGQLGLADFKREIEPDISGIPEAGWVISPAWHGKGVATEAMQAVVGWADSTLPAPRTCCIVDPEHAASVRVAEKIGYKFAVATTFGGAPTLIFYRERVSG